MASLKTDLTQLNFGWVLKLQKSFENCIKLQISNQLIAKKFINGKKMTNLSRNYNPLCDLVIVAGSLNNISPIWQIVML